LVRGDLKEDQVTKSGFFKGHCEYQRIHAYFKENTLIEYKGIAYSFKYTKGTIAVEKHAGKDYLFPKIMYVPAERNFVSTVDSPRFLKKLPLTLYTFLDEYEDAKDSLYGALELPINNTKFKFEKQTKTSWIVGEDYEVSLLEASSGFQSFVPLFLVTRYLAKSIKKKGNGIVREISIEEDKRIQKETENILKMVVKKI